MSVLKPCDSVVDPIPFLNNIIAYLQATQEVITPNYTSNIVNKIFRKTHKVYTSTNTVIECVLLASIYSCVVTRNELNPNYRLLPNVINLQNLQNLQENQFSIIQVPCLLNETYHFIILCNYDDDNFKVYNAYGNIYIKPFIINKALFLENYNLLLTNKANLELKLESMNNIKKSEKDFKSKKEAIYQEIINDPYIHYDADDFSQIPAVKSWKIITGVNLTKTFKSMFHDDGKAPEVIGEEFNEPNNDIPDELLPVKVSEKIYEDDDDEDDDEDEDMTETWNDYMIRQYLTNTINNPIIIYELNPIRQIRNPQLEVGVEAGAEAGGKRNTKKRHTKKHRKRSTRKKRNTRKRNTRKRNTKN